MNFSEPKHSPYDEGFFRSQCVGSRESARRILPLVMQAVPCASAVDIGCGVGTWLGVLKELGVRDVVGVDGAYVNVEHLEIGRSEFQAGDLTQPVDLGRRFDLALSLEVAEHLPARCAETFVDSLTRLAPVVLFSAAVPFQLGTDHVNEQWPEYWAEMFERRGYATVDGIREKIWYDQGIDPWYRQNILLFVRRDVMTGNAVLSDAQQRTDPRRLAKVHPGVLTASVGHFQERLAAATDPGRMSLKGLLRSFPAVFWHTARRRMQRLRVGG
jgi:SAM-dependent methyltransferase